MNAYVLRSGIRIEPFRDDPGDVLVLGERVQTRRAALFSALGLRIVHVERPEEIRDTEFLVLYDYVYCSRPILKRFLKAVRAHRQSRRLALESNPQIEMALPMQELAELPPVREGGPPVYGLDLFYVNGTGAGTDTLAGLAAEVVPIRQRVFEVDPPFYVRVEAKNRIGLSRSYCMHLKHWTHVYLLNLAALMALPFDWFWRRLLWALWKVLTAFSLNPFKILRRLVVKGKGCSIHPTAVVEASVLGDRVSIGAQAVVRGCYIGSGTRIAETAKVIGSVVGEGAEVAWSAIVNLSVLYPGACVGTPGLQTALVGREAFVSSMVIPLDVKFRGGYVSVRHRGKTVVTRLTTLGQCFGHRTRVGANVMLDSGRAIPNDVDVLPDPTPMLRKIPENLEPGTAYVVRGGTLIPQEAGKVHPPDERLP